MPQKSIQIKRLYDDSCIRFYDNSTIELIAMNIVTSDGMTIAKGDLPNIEILPGDVLFIGCGLSFEMSQDYLGIVTNNTYSVNEKHIIPAGINIIDCQHTGELVIPIINIGNHAQIIEFGESIARLKIIQNNMDGFSTTIKDIEIN